ncbi:glycosyltransferase family 2 protein [Winogradskyella bathintestinalis]|uniref:Glycosyltransferase family 2 protein n=1 Tax=Winogradskyella bathintestinalis TaxID=3035208 RepID=A0ABT7ZTY3_9FLAO|nr:glycosyltransferase family 2 protein [Winogradskyella bathintestinalis]MDN3492431.1 glycosyltransferase family 2 protein [Winogradskyella bathintestinalis]
MAPKVSIIIPNFNHINYLPQRLDSVFNQTYQDFEVILLDDASTDGSADILKTYQNHPNVSHVILNTVNSGGPFKQWKKGIELAKGKYIWIAESDDVAHTFFLEETVKFAESKQDLGLVFVASEVINKDDKLKEKKMKPASKTTGFTIESLEDISNYLIKEQSIPNASGVLFNTKILESINLIDLENFRNTGDRYAYIQIALKSKIYFLDDALNYFRMHGLNTTKRNKVNNKLYYDRLLIVEGVIPSFVGNKFACANLKQFYFKQIFICLKAGFLKKVNSVNYKMFKYGLISFGDFLILLFLSLFSMIFQKKLPYRIKNYYKIRFLDESFS